MPCSSSSLFPVKDEVINIKSSKSVEHSSGETKMLFLLILFKSPGNTRAWKQESLGVDQGNSQQGICELLWVEGKLCIGFVLTSSHHEIARSKVLLPNRTTRWRSWSRNCSQPLPLQFSSWYKSIWFGATLQCQSFSFFELNWSSVFKLISSRMQF